MKAEDIGQVYNPQRTTVAAAVQGYLATQKLWTTCKGLTPKFSFIIFTPSSKSFLDSRISIKSIA